MNRLLSKDDIEHICGHPIKMIIYDDLKKINDISSIFQKKYDNCVLLLYRTSINKGHWVGMKKIDNKILFFDSYGDHPDDQIDYSLPCNAFLSCLLLISNYEVHYNNHRLQGDYPVCGRYVAIFFKYCTDIDEFPKLLLKYTKKYKLKNDELIYLLTI